MAMKKRKAPQVHTKFFSAKKTKKAILDFVDIFGKGKEFGEILTEKKGVSK